MSGNLFGMIGMAKKAGKLAGGEFAVKNAVRTGIAKVVIIAADASDNTKKSIKNSCEYYKVKCVEYGDKKQLGYSTGSGEYSTVSVNDDNFAKAVLDRLNQFFIPGKDD